MSLNVDGFVNQLPTLQLKQAQRVFGDQGVRSTPKPKESLQKNILAEETPQERPERSFVAKSIESSEELGVSFQDVRQIAEKIGMIGLSDRDIRRAYVLGENLLADYRV